MQKIVLFIEPSSKAFQKPTKIGNLFMNRFAIDEDASSEILKIFELEKFSWKRSTTFNYERVLKGMDHFIRYFA